MSHDAPDATAAPPPFEPYQPYHPGMDAEAASADLLARMQKRRSIRMFSDRPVPRSVIEHVIQTAGLAPSGANKQPWRFVAVQDPALKREIREGAEAEEREFYGGRASDRWIRDLHPFGTDEHKPFLETVPWLIVVFKLNKDDDPNSDSEQVYYTNESVGIATGMLITAIHLAGLCTLTHTPSPMKFLGTLLGRPEYERPYLLLPVGYPADDCEVPVITKKPLSDIMVVDRG